MRKILVCIRAVPISESNFMLNESGNFYDETSLSFQVNEYDLFAMEEAVRIKERYKEVEVSVISVGPARVEEQVRKAMNLGGDFGFRIELCDANQRDAFFLASLLANWARDKNFDLILCGVMSEDLQRGQVGPMLAELLGIPCATAVISISMDWEQKSLVCERELEAGLREKVALSLPCLLTIQSGINVPRWPSLSNVLRIKKTPIPVIPCESLNPPRKSDEMVRVFLPEASRTCEFLKGEPGEIAEQLVSRIREKLHRL